MAEATMAEAAEVMTEAAEKIASYFSNVNVIKNDGLYAPLKQEGTICGVGVNLSLIHDPPLYDNSPQPGMTYSYIVVIDSIEPNTPAQKAGLLPRDILVKVNDTNLIDGQAFYLPDDVAQMIRGPEGSDVVVMIEREGRILRYVLTREPLDDTKHQHGTPSMAESVMRKVMPVTPESKRQLDSFEDRMR